MAIVVTHRLSTHPGHVTGRILKMTLYQWTGKIEQPGVHRLHPKTTAEHPYWMPLRNGVESMPKQTRPGPAHCPVRDGPALAIETRETPASHHGRHQTAAGLSPATQRYWQSRLTPMPTAGLTGYPVSW